MAKNNDKEVHFDGKLKLDSTSSYLVGEDDGKKIVVRLIEGHSSFFRYSQIRIRFSYNTDEDLEKNPITDYEIDDDFIIDMIGVIKDTNARIGENLYFRLKLNESIFIGEEEFKSIYLRKKGWNKVLKRDTIITLKIDIKKSKPTKNGGKLIAKKAYASAVDPIQWKTYQKVEKWKKGTFSWALILLFILFIAGFIDFGTRPDYIGGSKLSEIISFIVIGSLMFLGLYIDNRNNKEYENSDISFSKIPKFLRLNSNGHIKAIMFFIMFINIFTIIFSVNIKSEWIYNNDTKKIEISGEKFISGSKKTLFSTIYKKEGNNTKYILVNTKFYFKKEITTANANGFINEDLSFEKYLLHIVVELEPTKVLLKYSDDNKKNIIRMMLADKLFPLPMGTEVDQNYRLKVKKFLFKKLDNLSRGFELANVQTSMERVKLVNYRRH